MTKERKKYLTLISLCGSLVFGGFTAYFLTSSDSTTEGGLWRRCVASQEFASLDDFNFPHEVNDLCRQLEQKRRTDRTLNNMNNKQKETTRLQKDLKEFFEKRDQEKKK